MTARPWLMDRKPHLVAAVVLGLLLWIARDSAGLRRLDDLLFDARAAWAARTPWPRTIPPPQDILLVDIDEASLEALDDYVGQWPWPRIVHARLVEFASAARVIGFDILFLGQDRRQPVYDQRFAETMRDMGRVVLACHRAPGAGASPRWSMPEPALAEAAAAVGHVAVMEHSVALVRDHQPLLADGDRPRPSLPLAMVQVAETADGSSPESGAFPSGPTRRLGLDSNTRLRFVMPVPEAFDRIPFLDVMRWWQQEDRQPMLDHPERERFRDRSVLVGLSAAGTPHDLVATTLGPMPGVYVNAAVLHAMQTGAVWRMSGPVGDAILLAIALVLPVALHWRPRARTLGAWLGGPLLGAALALLLADSLRWMPGLVLPGLGYAGMTAVAATVYAARETRRRQQLLALEAAKQRFTDMLVHDLKGRMAGISMALQVLERSLPDHPDRAASMLGTASVSSQRMMEQIHALLDIRRLQEGRLPVRLANRSGRALVESVLHENQAAADMMNVGFDLDAHDPPIRVDPDILGRMVSNLVWNAVQHADQGSTVRIAWRDGDDGAGPALHVANDGPRVPPEDLDRLFTAFVTGTLDQDARGSMRSTGLGLAFVRLGAEAHGGAVSLHSPWRNGQGVEVVLQLPPVSPTDGASVHPVAPR